ncbi:carboxypeptidase-like regulatory domain-containing protein [Puia sp. P3]|uniref:carboxypeptidase-like regulatory domain-containing protein n=1 Tax=Puia sp. P3 TaxID=3423952 RepID=UPI003D666B1C
MENYRTAAHSKHWYYPAIALLALLTMLARPSYAQEKSDSLVTVSLKDRPFQEALSIIESRIHYKFAYSTELASGQKNISVKVSRMTLPDFLHVIFDGTTITWQMIGDQIVLQGPLPLAKITLSGYVKDARTGELLIGASIYLPSAGTGVLSNSYGFYSITAQPADTLELEISYVGYKSMSRRIDASDDHSLSFQMEHNDDQEEISKTLVFKDKREDNVKKNQTARVDLSSDMIAAAPSAGGSGDLINSVEMLPGVQAGIDGSPGYFVRGGNAGQNLILLDDATLYNPSHTFGLVGIFNPPTIKYATLMKGGFPASYGDHISSVLDVAMKDGSNLQTGGSVQAGTVSSGITLYGPLQKEKSSYLISARRSTTDIVLKPLLDSNYFSKYYFYDVNAETELPVVAQRPSPPKLLQRQGQQQLYQRQRKTRRHRLFHALRQHRRYTSVESSVFGKAFLQHFGRIQPVPPVPVSHAVRILRAALFRYPRRQRKNGVRLVSLRLPQTERRSRLSSPDTLSRVAIGSGPSAGFNVTDHRAFGHTPKNCKSHSRIRQRRYSTWEALASLSGIEGAIFL